jgi:hypothetical protein
MTQEPLCFCRTSLSFPERELKTQSICNFFNAPLISDQIAGRCNNNRLPSISVIFANLNIYVFNA